jgi:ribosomal protein S18 acetylase RimI-like enzyme
VQRHETDSENDSGMSANGRSITDGGVGERRRSPSSWARAPRHAEVVHRLALGVSEDLRVIRDFDRGDQAAVRDLVLEGLRERWGDAFDAAVNPDLDDIGATYVDVGADVVVLVADGRILATGTLAPGDPGQGRILRLAVDRRHRRQGLGRLVVDELVARARRRGLRELAVLTDTPWASAVALYRSCGFTEISRDQMATRFILPL